MATLHFTKTPPGEQMFSDVKSLNRFEVNQFGEFLDIVFSFLVSPKESSQFLGQISDFAQELGASSSALKNVTKSLLSFFKSALRANLTPAYVKEDLEQLGKFMAHKFLSCRKRN